MGKLEKDTENIYCKTSTNYKKWDVFESDSVSENEDDKGPIVPGNDTAFNAMKRDFEDHSKKRKRKRKEANRLKDLGNDCMKKGLYKKVPTITTPQLLRKSKTCLFSTTIGH